MVVWQESDQVARIHKNQTKHVMSSHSGKELASEQKLDDATEWAAEYHMTNMEYSHIFSKAVSNAPAMFCHLGISQDIKFKS